MATVKIKFRPSSIANHEGTIYYQLIHERKVRQFQTAYHVMPEEWDDAGSKVITSASSSRFALIQSIRERIRWDMERITKIIRKMESNEISYSSEDIIDEFKRYSTEYTLFNFMEGIIAALKRNGKIRTSETYKSALNSFKKFCKEEDIMLDNITGETMEAFEAWHRINGNAPNTISFYTRILRAVYNRAVEIDIIDDKHPFKRVYTGVDKTVKRALPIKIIKMLSALDLSMQPSLDYARDMFMLSFMLRGMSFIDMCYLKKTDLMNGFVTYRRRKTSKQLTIAWTREMQLILDKYPENETEYLLPIITKKGVNERNTYRNIGYNINRNLKKIVPLLGIDFKLTMYVARHSWASTAKAQGIPTNVISEGMGHDSEQTTLIYLASLDTSVVDRANAKILKVLKL